MVPRAHRIVFALEALLFLVVSRMLVRLLTFKKIVALLLPDQGKGVIAEPELIASVRWALNGWSRRVPFRAKCYEQGLAACMMLRRRKRAVQLTYGVRNFENRLVAHIWVKSGSQGVVGSENQSDFAALVQYPPS